MSRRAVPAPAALLLLAATVLSLVAAVPCRSLAKMDAATALTMILIDPTLTDDALLALVDPVTDADVDALAAALAGPLEACRVRAAVLLGRLRSPRAVVPLGAAVRSTTEGLPEAAVDALAATGLPALDQLVAVEHDPAIDASLREKAMREGLGMLLAAGPSAADRLADFIADPAIEAGNRSKAVAILLGTEEARAVSFLARWLRRPLPGGNPYDTAAELGRRGVAGVRELAYALLGMEVPFAALEDVRTAASDALHQLPRKEVLEICFAPLLDPGAAGGIEGARRSALLACGMERFAELQGSRERIVQTEAPYVVACVRVACLPSAEDPVVLDAAAAALRALRERGIVEGAEGEFPRLSVQLQLQGYRDIQVQLEELAKGAQPR